MQTSTKRQGAIQGLKLWLIFVIAGIIWMFLFQDGSVVIFFLPLFPFIFPVGLIILPMGGMLVRNSPKLKMTSLVILLSILFIITGYGLYFYYQQHFTTQRTIWFDLDKDFTKDVDGCYAKFHRTSPGKYGFVDCRYDEDFIPPVKDAKQPIAKGAQKFDFGFSDDFIDGINKRDCACSHSIRFQ